MASTMEFWGIEVKAGQPIKSDPGAGYLIHLSQASLGESKNKADSVPLYVNIDGKKLVLGTLSHQNFPQVSLDLVFDQEFELSHNWKNGSVYFLGYRTDIPEDVDDLEFDSNEEESSDEDLPVVAAVENGKAKADVKTAKSNAAKPDDAKPAAKKAEPVKTENESDDSGEDDSDSEDDSDDDEMSMDDSSDDEEEETPKKVESSKKRPAEAATPASTKKAKATVTPQKTDGKKGGHTATPHPAKQGGKNAAKTPKSFRSEGSLGSHKKAKHGGK